MVTSPWLRDYAHAACWAKVFDPVPLGQILERSALRHGEAKALDFLGRRYSYDELAGLAARAARGFELLGLGPGSRIGLFLPNTPHYPIAYYGALSIGATVVNFSPLYSAEEVIAQARDSGTEIMVCLDLATLFEPVRRALEADAVKRLIVGNLAEVLPTAQGLGYRLLKRSERVRLEPGDGHLAFRDLIDNDGRFTPARIDPEADVALIQYTGGTTGAPKGAALTHANLSVNAQQLVTIDPEPERIERVLGALPLFHIFANSCVLNRTLLRGGEIVLLPRFDAGQALAAIERRKITHMPGVPAMFQALLDHPDFERTDLTSLERAVSGGAAMTAALRERFEKATGAQVLEGYGLTESAGVVSVNPYRGAINSRSVGQPLPGTGIEIVDLNDPSLVVQTGVCGEITVTGPQVMRGYWRAHPKHIQTLLDQRLRTGDIGYLDPAGHLVIVDRLKDMINVGGFKVWPSQLESILQSHPAVKEAVVIGVPDERVGERPKAFVVLNPGKRAQPADLLVYLNGLSGKHERVEDLEIRTALPKTPIGKPSRRALAAEERVRAAGAAAEEAETV